LNSQQLSETVQNVSNNPDYRPSEPPQVGSQQFNNYGSQPQNGSGQYSQGQQYGQSQGYGQNQQYSQGQPYGQGGYSQSGNYSQGGAYGSYGQSGSYSQQNAYGQPDMYGQQGAYSQPMTYGAQPMFVRPVPNKMAVWAMWMGIIGLGGGFICGLLSIIPIIGYLFVFISFFLWIAPVLAVIFGHIGLSQIKRTGEDGRGQGIAGLIMGYVYLALVVLGVIIVVGFVGLGVFSAAMYS
jgi:hypothetical protein